MLCVVEPPFFQCLCVGTRDKGQPFHRTFSHCACFIPQIAQTEEFVTLILIPLTRSFQDKAS
jgi:hypothetical protein